MLSAPSATLEHYDPQVHPLELIQVIANGGEFTMQIFSVLGQQTPARKNGFKVLSRSFQRAAAFRKGAIALNSRFHLASIRGGDNCNVACLSWRQTHINLQLCASGALSQAWSPLSLSASAFVR